MRTVLVTFWSVDEKLPEANSMILAEGGEWDILMYEGGNVGYGWEDDQPVEFSEWAYLGDLNGKDKQ